MNMLNTLLELILLCVAGFIYIYFMHLFIGLILRVPFAIIGKRAWFERVWWYPFKWIPVNFYRLKVINNFSNNSNAGAVEHYRNTSLFVNNNDVVHNVSDHTVFNASNDMSTNPMHCNVPCNTSYDTIGAGSINHHNH